MEKKVNRLLTFFGATVAAMAIMFIQGKPVDVMAAVSADISIEDTIAADVGDVIEIPIDIHSEQELNAMLGYLEFDDTVLTWQSTDIDGVSGLLNGSDNKAIQFAGTNSFQEGTITLKFKVKKCSANPVVVKVSDFYVTTDTEKSETKDLAANITIAHPSDRKTETVIKNPTYTEEGEKKISCGVCGAELGREAIPVKTAVSADISMKESVAANVGDVIDIPINISCEQGLNAMLGYLEYDNSILTWQSTEIIGVSGMLNGSSSKSVQFAGINSFTKGTVVLKFKVEKCSPDPVNVRVRDFYVTTDTERSENISLTSDISITHPADQREETVIKDSTCSEKGEKHVVCKSCGADLGTEEIPMKAHTWDEGCVTRAATCKEDGEKLFTCTQCGGTKVEKIKASGHGKTEVRGIRKATCTQTGYTGDTWCTVCGEKVASGKTTSALGHTYGAWTVSRAATAIATGQQKHVCSRCKHVEYRTTAKLPAKGTLNSTSFPLKVKQSATLKVSQMAAGDYVKSWSNSNTSCATVDKNGKVTGKKKGTATITATLASGKKLTSKVTVQTGTVKTTAITVNTKNVTLKIGGSFQLTSVKAPFTSQESVRYSTKSSKIATVSSSGKITAKKPGTTYIYVKSGSKKVSVKVTVQAVKTTGLTSSQKTITVKKNKSVVWKAIKTPSNSSEGITYSTSNKKIATVSSSGKITGKSKGTVWITAKSGSKKISIKVTVN